MAQQTELEIMMSGFTEERKQSIREKADRLEVYFNTQGVVMMKKDEQWCDGLPNEGWDGMLQEGEPVSDFTKLDLN